MTVSVSTDRARGLQALGQVVTLLRDARAQVASSDDAAHLAPIDAALLTIEQTRHAIANGQPPVPAVAPKGPARGPSPSQTNPGAKPDPYQ